MAESIQAGCFFFVVGPSGAGKDSLIDGARVLLSSENFVFARRCITRGHDAPGEDHEAYTEQAFQTRADQGGFLITWQAHGLHYGLPADLLDELAKGRHVIANGSRAMVGALRNQLPELIVIEVTAPQHVLQQRLSSRGRETPEDIARRLNRAVETYPAGQHVIRVINDATLNIGIERFISAIQLHLAAVRP